MSSGVGSARPAKCGRVLLTIALLLTAACGSSRPSEAHDSGTVVDAGTDAGPCGAKPSNPNLPLCREGCSYQCGQQCGDICGARGCWDCLPDGGWQQEYVDCVSGCP